MSGAATPAAEMAALRALIARLRAAPESQRAAAARRITPAQLDALLHCWPVWAHPGQVLDAKDWQIWLIRAGRGFGKTRAGAEWVSAMARARPDARIALVGATLEDARRVMVEGQSGLLQIASRQDAPVWRPGAGEIAFPSGARAFVYSSERPDSLRGPEHHLAWCDEVAKWRLGMPTWDNLLMGLRLGERPQVLVTTTPRPTALMRRILAMPGLVETHGRTADNPHLPASFVATMRGLYDGTRLGRQELDGELIEEVEGALWQRDLLERQRVAAPPPLVRVVVGVDPPASRGGDACGIVVVGACADGHAWVLEDASAGGLGPEAWAARVADAVARHQADRVVVERNQGGDMVETMLRLQDPTLPVQGTQATRSKGARAEPVSLLYAQRRVWHVGTLPKLEDELCAMTLDGFAGPGRSPDRLDALVWAVWALLIAPQRRMRLRAL